MIRALAIAALAAAACGDGSIGDGDGLDFDIDLVDNCPTADPFFFGLMSVEIQLRGDSGGAPCVAARRCVPVTAASTWDVDAIESELRAVAQPLLSTELSAADFKIIGSVQDDCSFNDDMEVFLCGVAGLGEVSGGVLEVPVDCTPTATDLPACPVEPLPDCE